MGYMATNVEKNLKQKRLKRQCKRRSKEVYVGDDRISELPDGIIEDILSRLTMREAVRTSVLSRRWKDMWTYTTGSLDFDFGSKVMSFMDQNDLVDILEAERDNYVSWVNKILNAHKGSAVEEFKVEFYLESSHKSDIDSWIEFAIRKRVKRLELRLDRIHLVNFPFNPEGFYQFPAVEMRCLTSLNLSFVNVTGEVLEYLLMSENCPFLESVSIIFSESLVDVRVVSPCLKVKHLEIQYCLNLECIDIYSAPNLTSLSFKGEKDTMLCLREVPNLADVSLSGCYCEAAVAARFNQLFIPFSRVENLNLCLDYATLPQIHDFPVLKNLKQLELKSHTLENQSVLLSCSSMIKACPNLYKFSMQLNWFGFPDDDRQVQHCEDCGIHKNLKVVEFVWFRGKTTDIELATYLLTTSPFLEKIIADTRARGPDGIALQSPENISAKQCMSSLAQRLSPTALLVLL